MTSQSILYRAGFVGAVAALVWGWRASAGSRPQWLDSTLWWIHQQMPAVDRGLGIAAALLLFVYLIIAICWCFQGKHRHSYDASIGTAAAIVLVFLIGLASLLLAIGWFYPRTMLVRVVGAMVVLISLQLAIGGLVELYKWRRKHRAIATPK
jgi:hypothetical protein